MVIILKRVAWRLSLTVPGAQRALRKLSLLMLPTQDAKHDAPANSGDSFLGFGRAWPKCAELCIQSVHNEYLLRVITALLAAASLWNSARRLVSFAVTTFQAASPTN